MSAIRKDVVRAALNRSFALLDTNIHKGIHKHFEFKKQTLLADKSLTKDEKLKRFGEQDVILKKLENVENANQNWFEEVCNLNYLIKLVIRFLLNFKIVFYRLNHI